VPPPRAAARAPRGPAAAHADGTLTQAQYARRRGVSREAVRKAIRDGRIRLDASGRINPVAADAAWLANTDPGRSPAPAAALGSAPPLELPADEAGATGGPSQITLPDGMTYHEARALREWNQARMVDLQRRRLEGELVEVKKVEDAAFRAARTARDLLMALPDQLDAELAAMTDPAEVRERLARELRQVAEELASGLHQDPDVEDLAS